MATPNLAITTVVASQNQKEVTINDAFTQIDGATQDYVNIDCSGGGTVTLSSTNYTHYFYLRLTGSPSAAFTFKVPDGKRVFVIRNTTAKDATIRATSSGATLSLGAGQVAFVASRGVDLDQLTEAASSNFSMAMVVPGKPTDGGTVFFFKVTQAFTLPVDCAGSTALALTGSSGTVHFDIKKNGTDLGDITFTSSTNGTFTLAGGASFAVNDVFAIVAPSPQDSTLSDVALTFLCTRS